MGKLDDATREVATATTDVAGAVDALRETIEERLPVPRPEPRGYRSELRRPRALALGLRLCRDVEAGTSLAEKLKVVPPEYVNEDDGTISCICGATVDRGDLVECPGECGRWFCADGSGTWAVRLPGPDAA